MNRFDQNFDLIREIINVSTGYTQEDLTEGDIIALLDDWWPKSGESIPDNVKVNFGEVDQLLSLPPGNTKKHIMSVASRKGFKRVSSGNIVAVFEYAAVPDWLITSSLAPKPSVRQRRKGCK